MISFTQFNEGRDLKSSVAELLKGLKHHKVERKSTTDSPNAFRVTFKSDELDDYDTFLKRLQDSDHMGPLSTNSNNRFNFVTVTSTKFVVRGS